MEQKQGLEGDIKSSSQGGFLSVRQGKAGKIVAKCKEVSGFRKQYEYVLTVFEKT